nr:thioredoxin domain-containing protein [Streptomyces sp. HNM0575]
MAGIATAVTGEGGSETTQERSVTTGPEHARATLTVYEDFRCPGCRRFEERFGRTVEELQRSGKLRTEHHLVAHVDDTRGGHGSHRAAEAALCALDEHEFAAYRKVLYGDQPPEREDSFASREHLLRLAAKVQGLTVREFETCVRHGLQSGRADRMNTAYAHSGRPGPPVVLLDGKRLAVSGRDGLTPRQLRNSVEEKAG